MKNSIKIAVMAFTIILVGCTEKSSTTTVSTTPELENINLATVSNSIVENEREVVFITGYDKGEKTYYANAKSYFENQEIEIVESALSLQEIILWLNINYNEIPYTKIHIVNNSKLNEMSLETTIKGDKITTVTLENAVANGSLPALDNVLEADAKLIFHASGLGSNIKLMNNFKEIFTTDVQPVIIASENVSVFGSEFAPQYLAKPYYGFYPTAQSPGRVDLAKQFSKNYPNVEIDWLSVMNNSSERFLGDVYSYKFNVPVRWEIDFHADDELPSFPTTAALITWMQDNDEISAELDALGIPVEKFRWYQTIKDETLIIKGKVTVICVLEPVMDFAYPTQYMVPSIDNLRLYDTL
ncbi:MAG: hypothetical protein PSN34_07440 [Urechidicola sp.]|nr:hypothetical protein [Urechidicola sp.]